MFFCVFWNEKKEGKKKIFSYLFAEGDGSTQVVVAITFFSRNLSVLSELMTRVLGVLTAFLKTPFAKFSSFSNENIKKCLWN